MIKVGITHGDINGIGYEVILKIFSEPRMTEVCIPVIYGSSKVAGYHRKALDLPAVALNQINTAQEIAPNKINIINCVGDDVRVELGVVSQIAGTSALQALNKACDDLEKGLIDVLVTAPICKQSVQLAEPDFVNQTNYIEQRFADKENKSLTILTKDNLRIALLTTTLPLSEVPTNLTKEKLKETIRLFQLSLRRDFRIGNPSIAVLALNPNTGENGILGKEEEEIIKPTLKELQEKNILCFGPYAAADFFGSREYTNFDGIIAMYFDQGLTPFMSLTGNEGATFTAGLSVIRTAPIHGVEFEITGKNEAVEDSLRQAIYQAIDSYASRDAYDEAFKNPIRKLYVERGADNEVLDLTKENDAI